MEHLHATETLQLFYFFLLPQAGPPHHSPNKLSAFGGFGISRGGPAPPTGSLEDVSGSPHDLDLKSGEGEDSLGGEGGLSLSSNHQAMPDVRRPSEGTG